MILKKSKIAFLFHTVRSRLKVCIFPLKMISSMSRKLRRMNPKRRLSMKIRPLSAQRLLMKKKICHVRCLYSMIFRILRISPISLRKKALYQAFQNRLQLLISEQRLRKISSSTTSNLLKLKTWSKTLYRKSLRRME